MNINFEQDFWAVLLLLVAVGFGGWLLGRFLLEQVIKTLAQGLLKLAVICAVLLGIGFGLYFVSDWAGVLPNLSGKSDAPRPLIKTKPTPYK